MSLETYPETGKIKKIDIRKTESVDWDFELDSESNKADGVITYTDNFDNGDWLQRAPQMESEHPQYKWLKLTNIKGKRIEGGMIKVTLSYVANSDEATYPGRPKKPVKRYSLERTLNEEPLLSHPKFQDLDEDVIEILGWLLAGERTREAIADAKAKLALLPGYNAAAQKAFDLIRRGVEAYLAPTYFWKEKRKSKDLTDIDGGSVGKILEPPGSPPTPTGRTWLYMGLSGDQTENAENYDIDRSWQLSDAGGWDTFLYGEDEP